MSFSESFTIVNNSGYTLVLDPAGSSSLGNGDWPATIAPHSTPKSFTQSVPLGYLNPTAVYQAQGAVPAANIYLHFYCIGVAPALHVNMTMVFSTGTPFPGSSIAENNTNNGHSYVTNNTTLNIGTTGNGTSGGSAIFTIGNN
jgi:hypothetical protein